MKPSDEQRQNGTLDARKTELQLCDDWKGGDQDAATELYRRYMSRLLEVLGRNLATRFHRRVDPESVMISAFHSLLRRSKDSQFSFNEDADVWKTLLTIGLNKLRNRVRDAQSQRNNINREVYGDFSYDETTAAVLAGQLRDDDALIFADLLENLLNRLSPGDQEIIRFRIEGLSSMEIGERLTERLTSRSVNRRLNGQIAEAVRSLMVIE